MKLTLHDVLHILRNPAWNTAQRIEAAQQQAADMLEQAYGADRVVLSLTQERATQLLKLLAEQPMGAVQVLRGHPRDPGIEAMRNDDEYMKDGDV